jgi:hypothetical protein
MSRIFQTGLETGSFEVFTAYIHQSGTASISSSGPRTGSFCLNTTKTGEEPGFTGCSQTLSNPKSEIFVRDYVKMPSYPNSAHYFLGLLDGIGSLHLSVGVSQAGQLLLYRGDPNLGALLGGGGVTLSTGTYYRVEIRATIHDSTGIAQVRVDGQLVIDFTGDTRSGGNANIQQVQFGAGRYQFGSTAVFIHDDIAINDTEGSVNNSWPGQSAIYAIRPEGPGTYSQLTRGGADSGANWSQVEEAPPTDDTDYVESPTADEKDSYAGSACPTPAGTVRAVNWIARAKQDVAGAASVARFIRVNGSDQAGSDQQLDTSWKYYQELMEVNPATGVAFTIADLNGIEPGVVVR